MLSFFRYIGTQEACAREPPQGYQSIHALDRLSRSLAATAGAGNASAFASAFAFTSRGTCEKLAPLAACNDGGGADGKAFLCGGGAEVCLRAVDVVVGSGGSGGSLGVCP